MKYMKALCYKCNHSWNHKGKIIVDKKYITCPRCYYKIRVDKTLDFSTEEHQNLLTNQVKLPSLPNKLPTTHYSAPMAQPIEASSKFVEIRDPKDNFLYHDKKILKQFREVLDEEEIEETPLPGIEEQEPTIRILPPKFEIIRVIPYDNPIKQLKHQKDYGLRIANILFN